MKAHRFVAIVASGVVAISAAALAEPTADATYQDIQKTLGFVPGFFKVFPENGIAAAWDEMKSIQLNPKTALTGQTKELIGLAVSSQIPCKYCIYFHTKTSKMNGASDKQQKEAIAIAALERHWSTVLNGMQIDLPQFKQEVAKMFQYIAKPKPASDAPAESVTDAASAYKDIERTFGMVPRFMKQFPEAGVAPAWREVKALLLDPNTALDAKTKDLIGLAVSAQTPCSYCVYMDTEAARHDGASDQEIREAVAAAAIVRHWSTVLNGAQVDEVAFRKDVDHLVRNVEKANKTAQQP